MVPSSPHRILVVLLAAACSAPPPPDPLAPRAVHERGRWTAAQDGVVLGRVVLLEIDDPAEPVRMYRAENAVGQWLGYVDVQGRVFQRVPFEAQDVFRGIYPMDEGLALLYEVDGPVDLVPADSGVPTDLTVPTEAAVPREAAVQFLPREDR